MWDITELKGGVTETERDCPVVFLNDIMQAGGRARDKTFGHGFEVSCAMEEACNCLPHAHKGPFRDNCWLPEL